MNPIDSAPFAEFLQIVEDLAIAIHRATFQPRLLDVSEQAPIFLCTQVFRINAPGVVTAVLNSSVYRFPLMLTLLPRMMAQNLVE